MLNTVKTFLSRQSRLIGLLRFIRRSWFPNESDLWEKNSLKFTDYLTRLNSDGKGLVFVKVGANDGVSGDPCARLFLENSEWRGLLVEPVPYLAEKLGNIYSDKKRFTIEQVAIGGRRTQACFYYVREDANREIKDLPSHFDMLGSFDRQHIIDHFDGVLEPYIVEVLIDVETLAELLDRNGVTQVDLLQVDTEGFDWEVLQSLDFQRVKPKAIYIEHKHLTSESRADMRKLLTRHNYSIYDCGNDFFAFVE